MKINEVTSFSTLSLFETIDADNNTGYLTEDLVKIFQEAQAGKWVAGAGKDQPFMRGELYDATYKVRVLPYPAVRKKFRDFMEIKRNNPRQPFGSSDKPFRSGGNFDSAVPGLMHAHITFDLSIVYKVVGNQIYLYGFFTHDDLGTGQPANLNRQKGAASRLANQTFKE
jgi:hypothetical protein